MRRAALITAALAVALVVSACGATATRMSVCQHHGAIQQVRIQSVNAAFITCRDGSVYRYDTNKGS